MDLKNQKHMELKNKFHHKQMEHKTDGIQEEMELKNKKFLRILGTQEQNRWILLYTLPNRWQMEINGVVES